MKYYCQFNKHVLRIIYKVDNISENRNINVNYTKHLFFEILLSDRTYIKRMTR